MEQAHETFHLTRSVQHESSSPRVINNICTAKCDPSSNHVNANRTSLPKQYKKNVHLWIVAFLIILIVMILGIRIIYITSNSLVNVNLCQSIECVNVMRQIKSSIHEHIDPCDDFYQFACQGWILDYASKLEEQGENATDTIDEIGEANKLLLNDLIDGIDHHNSSGNSVEIKAKLLYLSCLNKNGTLSDNLESLQYLLMGADNATTDSSESSLVDTESEYENELDEHYTTQNSDDMQESGEDDDEDEWGLADFLSIDEDSTPLACMECTLKLFPQTVGRLFVQQYYLHQEPSVNKLLSVLQLQFESTIKQMHWIDEESKRNITENIFSNLTILVGYSNITMNTSMIRMEDDIYENVTVSEHGDKFLSNMQSLLEVLKFHADDFEDETTDHSNHADEMVEQLMATTTTMEMQYRPDLNAVIIPVGIVQRPLFHPGFPNVINFARLGMMVGHEFGHALIRYMDGFTDETGIKYPSQIVTNRATLDGYKERCQCVKEQYDGFQISSDYKLHSKRFKAMILLRAYFLGILMNSYFS
ncbi:endothelin-converting enzyme homolog isoform X2 [Folsomia candida]|uniref:endothelin-converting enzyme homolog isoform X2 n=1 Tax=Folsomia candida TaxID=158441 RepID=UPI001604B3B6|nr:endothelin-converting enzyme homolog isoform X2 [Folsomia candida]